MSGDSRNRIRCGGSWVMGIGFLVLVGAGSARGAAPTLDHPIVAGFERFFADPDSNAIEGGRLLWTELSCGSCHRAAGKATPEEETKRAPILDAVGTRIRPEYLQTFLTDPQATKPGTTMPNLLAHLPAEERREA